MPAREYAIIVAGGSGQRMKSDTPKQFIPVCGLPILMHTILAFHQYSNDLHIIVVLPSKDMLTWEDLCRQYDFNIPFTITTGGETRFQSVKNGLAKTGSEGTVAIHDGVRPLVDKELIAASFQIAALHGSAIAAVRLKESLRITDKDQTRTVDRSKFRIIQTPQTFRIDIVKKAYEQKEISGFTDDASVAERAGFKISLFEGSYTNIKITTPEDLLVAEALLNQR